MTTPTPQQYIKLVWGYKQGQMISLMIHIGDRLGLYAAMRGKGAMSAHDLANCTKLNERWILEWLRGQVAAKLLVYVPAINDKDHERFKLNDAAAMILADENHQLFAAGAFHASLGSEGSDAIVHAFRTGRGISYENMGEAPCHQTSRMLGSWTKKSLLSLIIPGLTSGVYEKLERGILVLDVGCGAGVACNTLAQAFPKSTIHGYDPSQTAIEKARKDAQILRLNNVEYFEKPGESIPSIKCYDFVMTLDCMHDMPRPDLVMSAIKKAMKKDGTWLIKDIKSSDFVTNLRRNPMLPMLYGFSMAACLLSATSTSDGLGLGTLGFTTKIAQKMTQEAGFNSFEVHDFRDPANLYYEVRHGTPTSNDIPSSRL